MKATITTEQEGILYSESLESMTDYLSNIAEISDGPKDFIRKVEYGCTDETNGMSTADHNTLEDWYFHSIFSK